MQVVAHNEELEGSIWVFIDEEVKYNIVEVHGKCDYKVSEVLSWNPYSGPWLFRFKEC